MTDEKIEREIEAHYPLCKRLADYITENPELGMREYKAVAAYRDLLEKSGFVFESPLCGFETAFRAVKKERSAEKGARLAFMCEYDALAEVGHACGHSISGAASALAAIALHAAYPDLPLRVDLLGTPGEESPGGKALLLEKGAFSGYEAAAMAHMASYNSPTFHVLACTDRAIVFTGKAAHASVDPQSGINALNAARLYFDAMDMWRQHLPRGAQFHGIFTKGGYLPNIVPDDVELDVWFRGATLRDLDRVCEISERCCKAAALATGCAYTAKQQNCINADLYNTPSGDALLRALFDAMLEPFTYSASPAGSTDAGNVDCVIPVFHPMIDVSGGEDIPLHTAAFCRCIAGEGGERGLRSAATLLANLALALAKNPAKLASIQAENRAYRQRGGKK